MDSVNAAHTVNSGIFVVLATALQQLTSSASRASLRSASRRLPRRRRRPRTPRAWRSCWAASSRASAPACSCGAKRPTPATCVPAPGAAPGHTSEPNCCPVFPHKRRLWENKGVNHCKMTHVGHTWLGLMPCGNHEGQSYVSDTRPSPPTRSCQTRSNYSWKYLITF